MAKKYYWLKLKDDFFNQKEIKKLRRIAGGDTYTIIYLKMQLQSIKKEGIITFDGTEKDLAEQLSIELDEDVDNITILLAYLKSNNLIEELEEDNFLLTRVPECIGKESESAERVRKHRQRKALEGKEDIVLIEEPKQEPYSNNKRQKMYRAKKNCEKQQHIPFIEDYANKERYNGNYYIVLQRDKYKCALCNDIENLCVHHIDGYNESVTENSNENKLITLCRKCHSNIHAGNKINEDVLNSIGYNDLEENVTLHGNVTVTKSNTEKEKEKEKERREKRKDTEKEKKGGGGVEENISLKEVFNAFTKHNFMLSPAQFDEIQSDLEQYGINAILAAIKISDDNNKRTYAYFKAVLNNIYAKGIEGKNGKNLNNMESKPKVLTEEFIKKMRSEFI